MCGSDNGACYAMPWLHSAAWVTGSQGDCVGESHTQLEEVDMGQCRTVRICELLWQRCTSAAGVKAGRKVKQWSKLSERVIIAMAANKGARG